MPFLTIANSEINSTYSQLPQGTKARISSTAASGKRIEYVQAGSAIARLDLLPKNEEPSKAYIASYVEAPKSFEEMTITSLNDEEFELQAAVNVQIYRETDGFTVSNAAINVHAFGRSLDEAISDWKETVIDLFLCFCATPVKDLAPSGKKMRDRLSEIVYRV